MAAKLANLGIQPGKPIKKVSQLALKGPVIVEVSRAQLAIGFGMASRIFVKAAEEEKDGSQ